MNALSQISSEMSAALALDLAADIWPEADVFKNHGVEPVYGAALMQQEWFKKMIEEARREWNSITNAKQRIRLKSQLAVEHSIDELYTVITDKTVPAQARVAAFKELKDLSGAAAQENSGAGGPAVPTVNIFLNGADEPSVSISTTKRRTPAVEDAYEEDIVDVTPGNPDDWEIEGLAPIV